MRQMILSFLLLILSANAFAAFQIKPKVEPVTLKKFTQISVPIVPDLGTRLVFPFPLDEKSEYVPFTLNTTNEAFDVPKPEPGRNVIVVTLPASNYASTQGEPMLGSIYITVGGYQITVLLRSTVDVREYVSDVNFELGDKERQNLINLAVESEIESMRQEYEKKTELLHEEAQNLAYQQLGKLLLEKPERSNIYEKTTVDLDSGVLSISVPRYLVLGTFRAYELSVRYSAPGSVPLNIVGAKLFGRERDGNLVPISATADMPSFLNPGDERRGILVTKATNLERFVGFEITVNSSEGEASVKW